MHREKQFLLQRQRKGGKATKDTLFVVIINRERQEHPDVTFIAISHDNEVFNKDFTKTIRVKMHDGRIAEAVAA